MDELNEFANQVLANLLSDDADFRQNAEKIYENIPPKNKIHLLFMTISDDSKPDEIRQQAAVLLRRVIFKSFDDISKEVDQNYFVQLRDSILVLVQKPDNISMPLRKKICDIIAELAPRFMDDGNNRWPELLNFMFTAANSSSDELKECSLNILNSYPTIFGVEQNKYLDFIHKMLLKCLVEESGCQSVKLAALKATVSFILVNDDEKPVVKIMQDTVVPMLQITSVLVENDDDSPLLSLIELVDKCPQILRPNFNILMDMCMKMITNTNDYSEDIRHSAIEIVCCYAEKAAGTFRKRGTPYLVQLVSQFLMMMTDIEHDDSWSQTENDNEDEDVKSDRVVGEMALDRLACALGGKLVFPLAINIISQMLQNADWKQRAAALIAISVIGEGCEKQMSPILDQIVNAILPFITDPHPRVRFSVCVALGQMSSDFAPTFQERFHDKFIPNLLLLLDDTANPKVQAHAGAAFVNFFEEGKPKYVMNYVPAIVDKFEQVLKLKIDELMKKGSKMVLEQIVISIASLSDLLQEMFINYYDRFMPYLKFIIENANHKDLRLLRGKAIECASLIGLAVGSEKFCNDASQIMNLLLQTQTGELILDDDDPQLSYMITSWVRICKLLGPKFEPYLPMVMPQVLKTASMKIEMALLDDNDAQNMENSSDWKFFNLEDQQHFGIKVSGLEDKATACEMLVCYARELRQGFVEYLEDTVKTLVPLLKYYLHEDIVSLAAAQSLPYLLDCAKIRGDNYVLELWNYILPQLLEVLNKETESEVLTEMLVSLTDCISTLGMSAFNEQQMEALIKVLDYHFTECLQRFQERQERRHDEDYDDGVEEILNEEDEDDGVIMSRLIEVLHSLFVAYNEKFLPFFNHLLLKHVANLSCPNQPVKYQQCAICVIDDLIEFTGVKCIDYKDFFQPLLETNIKSPHPEVRQAATYGIGALAKHGGEAFAKFLSDQIPTLVAVIQDPNSRMDENIFATENAISAVTKIMQYNGSMVDVDSLLPVWLSWLPIWEDEEEVIHVFSFLYQLLERNHPLIVGNENCNVPHIVSAILEVFARDVIEHTSELGRKLISYVKFVNPDKSIQSKFSAEQRQVLEQIANL